jgi:DNA-binding NarL/FixJ family response regulator
VLRFGPSKIILLFPDRLATLNGLILPDKSISARRSGEQKEKPRVLIVEDDAMIAWDMSLSLEAAGFQVCGIVSNGAAALEQANHAGPDVVLMDVNLKQGMDGIETARALRARQGAMPIIFVTGFGDPETSARIRSVNPDGYLLKPVMPEELESAIIRALETGVDDSDD